jgi:hypothetical protein
MSFQRPMKGLVHKVAIVRGMERQHFAEGFQFMRGVLSRGCGTLVHASFILYPGHDAISFTSSYAAPMMCCSPQSQSNVANWSWMGIYKTVRQNKPSFFINLSQLFCYTNGNLTNTNILALSLFLHHQLNITDLF